MRTSNGGLALSLAMVSTYLTVKIQKVIGRESNEMEVDSCSVSVYAPGQGHSETYGRWTRHCESRHDAKIIDWLS